MRRDGKIQLENDIVPGSALNFQGWSNVEILLSLEQQAFLSASGPNRQISQQLVKLL